MELAPVAVDRAVQDVKASSGILTPDQRSRAAIKCRTMMSLRPQCFDFNEFLKRHPCEHGVDFCNDPQLCG
jgi:hypothetical protein